MTSKIFLAFFIAVVISLIGVPIIIKLDKYFSLGKVIRDHGPRKHKKKAGTPTMGGIAIIIAIMSSLFLTGINDPMPIFAMIMLFLFGFIGFIDDWICYRLKTSVGLTARYKLLLQIIFAVVVGYGVWRLGHDIISPFSLNTTNMYLYLGWFALIVVASSNSVNLTDGLDGLAAVIYIICSFAFMIIAFAQGMDNMAIISSAACGACLGFLWYNFFPAKIFMGDVGSLALGAPLGFQALYTKTELLLPFIAVIFVAETLSVIIQVIYFKITKGKRIFKMTPLHHHFELSGVHEALITFRFAIVNALCAGATLLLYYWMVFKRLQAL
ncbi:MAG: phospho-N-acetylmuramoyl-pentapeptide-transferase [Armatimonadota bacterium]